MFLRRTCAIVLVSNSRSYCPSFLRRLKWAQCPFSLCPFRFAVDDQHLKLGARRHGHRRHHGRPIRRGSDSSLCCNGCLNSYDWFVNVSGDITPPLSIGHST